MAAYGKAQHGKTEMRKELALLAIAHRGVYVHQSSQASASHLIAGVLKGLHKRRPAVFNIYTPCPVEHGLADDWSQHAARSRSRAAPSRSSPTIPTPARPSPTASASRAIRRSTTPGRPTRSSTSTTTAREQAMDLPLTIADWAATEGALQAALHGDPAPRSGTTTLLPFHEYLGRSTPRSATDATPYILALDKDRTLAPAPRVAGDRASSPRSGSSFWSQLRQLAGLEIAPAVHDAVAAELEAEFEASSPALRAEYEAKIAELKRELSGADRAPAGRGAPARRRRLGRGGGAAGRRCPRRRRAGRRGNGRRRLPARAPPRAGAGRRRRRRRRPPPSPRRAAGDRDRASPTTTPLVARAVHRLRRAARRATSAPTSTRSCSPTTPTSRRTIKDAERRHLPAARARRRALPGVDHPPGHAAQSEGEGSREVDEARASASTERTMTLVVRLPARRPSAARRRSSPVALPIRRMPYPGRDHPAAPAARRQAGDALREGGRPRRARRHGRRRRRLHVGADPRVRRRHGGGHRLVAAPRRLDGAVGAHHGGPLRAAGAAPAPRAALGRAHHRRRSCARCRTPGVVGLGGAAFPTHVKLAPPTDHRGAHADHQRRRVRAVSHLRPSHHGRVSRRACIFGIRVMMRCLRRHQVRRRASSATSPTRSRRCSGARPDGPRRHDPAAHGEVSAGRREDAHPGGDRDRGPLGEAAGDASAWSCRTSGRSPRSPRSSRPGCRSIERIVTVSGPRAAAAREPDRARSAPSSGTCSPSATA